MATIGSTEGHAYPTCCGGISEIIVKLTIPYSSLFLLEIVETVRKNIPRLIFVWAKDEADVWLLFSVESNVRDAKVRGRIIRSLEPGQLRLIKQYAATGKKVPKVSLWNS